MQIDIAESIRETLAEFNSVGLYGIGTISLNHIPASFGHQRKSLLPPNMELNFTNSSSSNAPLFDWLIQKYSISQAEAEKVFKKFCEKMLNAIVNYGKVNLTGVALFQKSEDSTLLCTPDKRFLELFYKGLPAVPIKILERDLKMSSSIVSENTETVKDIAVVASGLVDLKQSAKVETEIVEEIIIPEATKEEISTISNTPIESISENVIVENIKSTIPNKETPDTFFESSNTESSKIKTEVVDNTRVEKTEVKSFDESAQWDPTPLNTNHEADGFFNGRNIALILGLLLLLVLGYYGCQKYFGGSNNNLTTENLLPAAIDTTSNGLVDSSALINQENPLPEKCIIITGAFKKSRNIIRMNDRLLRDGFEIYQAVEGDLTRVGFKFDCHNVDLEEYLQNIRRTISKKSWYLDPSLYVEYE